MLNHSQPKSTTSQQTPGNQTPPVPSELQANNLPPLFAFGQIVATPAALERLLETGADAFELLARHGRGDWGDLSDDDKKANQDALKEETRLLSAYELPDQSGKIWVITEADRSATTLLLPSEY